MSLSVKPYIALTVFAINKLFLPHEKPVFKSFSRYLFQAIFYLHTFCQYTIITPYALITNNILISFYYPLCNLKRFIFLIVSPINIELAFLFASRYFSLFVFPCFHSFQSFYFSLNFFLPSSLHQHASVSNWAFCPSENLAYGP